MKVNLKSIGKGLAAAGTLIGGAILALQTKKGLKELEEFDSTLEPLGEETNETEEEQESEEEKQEEEDNS